jgi:hypothetical protein
MNKTYIILLITIGAIVPYALYSKIGIENKYVDIIHGSKNDFSIDKSWFRNSLYGFSFETPEELKKITTAIPKGYEEYLNTYETYIMKNGDLLVLYIYMDSKFKEYDLETGIKGSIQNSVNVMQGTFLKVNFEKPKGELDDLLAHGTFILNGSTILVNAYIYWNGNGKIAILTNYIPDTDKNKLIIERIINSRQIAF